MQVFNSHAQSRRGILFVATGQRYLEEAAANAVASRRFSGSLPIAVSTDLMTDAQCLSVFDHVLQHPDPCGSYRDKIPALLKLPFSETLYLDSDARLIASVEELFDVFGHFHIAAAHAPVRRPDGWNDDSIPALFPEFNSGVIMLRRSLRQSMLVRRWLHLYDLVLNSNDLSWDQASFRSVLWQMQQRWGLRLLTLPSEANLRITKPWVAGKGLLVYVVHGRVPDCEWLLLENYLNGDINHFRYWSEWKTMFPDSGLELKVSPNPLLL